MAFPRMCVAGRVSTCKPTSTPCIKTGWGFVLLPIVKCREEQNQVPKRSKFLAVSIEGLLSQIQNSVPGFKKKCISLRKSKPKVHVPNPRVNEIIWSEIMGHSPDILRFRLTFHREQTAGVHVRQVRRISRTLKPSALSLFLGNKNPISFLTPVY